MSKMRSMKLYYFNLTFLCHSIKRFAFRLILLKEPFGRYFNINNVYFDNMVSQIYPSELQLNKANAFDTKAAFLDLHLSISNDIVSTKIYDKRDDFNFEIANYPF